MKKSMFSNSMAVKTIEIKLHKALYSLKQAARA